MAKRLCGNCRYCVRKNCTHFCNCFQREVENEDAVNCPNFVEW